MAYAEQPDSQRDPWGRYPDDPDYGIPPRPAPAPAPEIPAPAPAPAPDPGQWPEDHQTPNEPGQRDPNLGGGLGSLLQPYSGSFQRPDMGGAARDAISWLPQLPNFNAPNVPQFQAFDYPQFQAPEAFHAPKGDEIYQDPSYQFRLEQGQKALESSAAGKGTLRTGGTLKDLLGYGQNFASQEYGNIYNRKLGENQQGWNNALDAYKTNFGSKLDTYKTNFGGKLDTFDRELQSAKAAYEPNVLRYTTEAQVGQRGAENAYDRAWNEYLQGYNQWRTGQNDIFDKLKWQSEFGLKAAGG